jgi:hypothetical protein
MPATPPPPGRLSMMNCWPRRSLIFLAVSRMVTSAMPPAP